MNENPMKAGAMAQTVDRIESKAERLDSAIKEIETVVKNLSGLMDTINPRPETNEKEQSRPAPPTNLHYVLIEGPDRIYESISRAHALIDEIKGAII